MAYSSWSVTFGEQPSAAKWNILGTNDAHFYSFLGDNLAWQSFSPNATGFSSKTDDSGSYTQVGKTVIFRVSITGTSNATTLTFTLPVASVAVQTGLPILIRDNGTTGTDPGRVDLGAASTTATVFRTLAGLGFTASGAKWCIGVLTYEAA